MEPKDLARAFEDKAAAKEAAHEATVKKAAEVEKTGKEKLAAGSREAMTKVAIPFLTEVKAAMGPNFSFEVSRDVASHEPVMTTFVVKGKNPVAITLRGSVVDVKIKNGLGPQGSGAQYSKISTPTDLTRDKLSALINEIING
jgi:hypothetical protein